MSEWKDAVPVALAVIGLFTAMVATLCWVVKKLVGKFSTDMCRTQARASDLSERMITILENHIAHNTEVTCKHTVAVQQLIGHTERQTAAITRMVSFVEKFVNGKRKKY